MPTQHTVAQGECMASIACNHGFVPETIWNHPDNSALKEERGDLLILHPGDVVVIPDLRPREESGATETKHRFRRKGVPMILRMKFFKVKPPEEGEAGVTRSGGQYSDEAYEDPEIEVVEPEFEPRKNEAYRFECEGRSAEGSTDGEGLAELTIMPGDREARIIFSPGTDAQEVIPLGLGEMDPVSQAEGVRKRLLNLGFLCEPDGPLDAPDLAAVLREFQEAQGLEVTGEADSATQDKLVEVHGS